MLLRVYRWVSMRIICPLLGHKMRMTSGGKWIGCKRCLGVPGKGEVGIIVMQREQRYFLVTSKMMRSMSIIELQKALEGAGFDMSRKIKVHRDLIKENSLYSQYIEED